MKRSRSRLEIRVKVLQVISDGEDMPTRIMYASNISWQPLMKVLAVLIEKGFVLEVDDTSKDLRVRKRYHITLKGMEVLRAYETMKKLVM